ncbi:hypothetical protein [Flavobacterium sp. JP2137]|uniref:hypothetical protein n=1 Tax=Flavobacterium sp. JP2137 TaxID=3414510 RepID=UPI003D2FB26C
MKTIGFPISQKKNERRRGLIPSGFKNKKQVFVENEYGQVLGYSDQDYIDTGVNVVSTEEVLSKDIICDGKIGDAAYLDKLKNQTINGWVHPVQHREITHNVVDHTTSIFYKTISKSLSHAVSTTIDMLLEEAPNECLMHCVFVENDQVINQRINEFQNRI